MEGFTDTQMRTLAIMPKFSSAIGIAGDLIIINEILVLDRPNKLKKAVHRIVLAMSICDLISTAGLFLSTWPIPKEEEGLFYNVGNQGTCVFQGFLVQFGISLPLLNMCLAIYYILVIQYSWKEEQIRKKVEPFFYGLSLSFAIATSSASVALGLFNSANLWCWTAATPSGCNQSYEDANGETDCLRGDNC
jgi:predicted cation transporter